MGFGSHASEAPRPETPCQLGAPSRRATRLDRAESTSVAHQGCGTPLATAPPRTVSRPQSFVTTDWDIQLRPNAGEGRNTMVKRGRCASPLSESVHSRLGFSMVIEEQNETDRKQIGISPLTDQGREEALRSTMTR